MNKTQLLSQLRRDIIEREYLGTSYRNYNFLPLYKLKLHGFGDLLTTLH